MEEGSHMLRFIGAQHAYLSSVTVCYQSCYQTQQTVSALPMCTHQWFPACPNRFHSHWCQ